MPLQWRFQQDNDPKHTSKVCEEWLQNNRIQSLDLNPIDIMGWGRFSDQGIGPIYHIDGIMDRFMYCDILQNVILPYAKDEIPLQRRFQQDNDPKHTSKVCKEWLQNNRIQSLDLNPIGIMGWGRFSGQGMGPIYHIDGIIDRSMYCDILQNVILPYAKDEMPLEMEVSTGQQSEVHLQSMQ